MATMRITAGVLMGLMVIAAAAGMALGDGRCSKSKPCPGGECCSQYGYCGCSDEYCGQGCINDCNGCDGRLMNASAMVNPNAQCSKTKSCPGGECCSQFGFCGCSDEYCGNGCINDCNGCDGRLENARAMLNPNAQCSKTKSCPGGECCSQFGFCGCSDEYCGQGCINNCNGCDGRVKNARAMLKPNAQCSKTKSCPGGECCSQFGFCGCSDEYCGNGCINDCNGCDGRVKNAPAMLNPNAQCSKTKSCPGGECCSQFGFCGCSDEYCGNGCINDCNGCDGGNLGGDSGQATYYTTYVPSSCYGFDTKPFPAGNMIAAASSDVFGNRAACGTYYEITCKGATSGGNNPCKKNPTVKVMVVDLCPGCNRNSFDLSKEAFSKIANLDAGRINISARRVSKNHNSNEEGIAEVI